MRTAVEYKTSDSEVFVLTKKLLSPLDFAGEPLIALSPLHRRHTQKREPQLLEALFRKSGDDLLSHKATVRSFVNANSI